MTTQKDLIDRTKMFALRRLHLADVLPRTVSGKTIANQIARSGTSVAANCRAAQRARSKAALEAKVSIVHEEADGTLFWLERIEAANPVAAARLMPLKNRADDITAISVSSLKTAKRSP